MNGTSFVPNELRKTILCFTHVRPGDSTSDLTTCHSNGYVYEIKKNKIISSLNMNGEKVISISSYYLTENDKFILFYLLFTTTHKLFVVRRFDSRLQVVKVFKDVEKFEVFDFKCVGYPQIMINYINFTNSLVKFPVEQVKKIDKEKDFSSSSNLISHSLNDKLQVVYKHIDNLTEEYESLRKICNHSIDKNSGIVQVGVVKFSSGLDEISKRQLTTVAKWQKVLGQTLILGMRICNTGNIIIQDLEMVVDHKDIKEYTCRFFSFFTRAPDDLFSPLKMCSSLSPEEEIFVVGAFLIPAFILESEIIISCYLITSSSLHCLLKETFRVNVVDIATQHAHFLDEQFTGEDWMSILTVKSETRLKVETGNMESGTMESIFRDLGFKKIKHVKDKLLYCTSKYLNEVFVALRQIAINPTVWRIHLYTSDELQVYFLVNVLYDLLPENTTVLSDNR